MEYLNNKEAMDLLKIKSLNTLKSRIKDGLKCYGTGRKRRFKESDISIYLENGIGEVNA